MIAATVDGSCPGGKYLIRARDLNFWLAEFFPFCSFRPLSEIPPDFDFLFVFNPALFPACTESAGRELQHWLKRQSHSKPRLYAAEKMPFFIVTKAYFAEKNIVLKTGIFNQLRAEARAGFLPCPSSFPVYLTRTEARKIENAVIDLQIARLHHAGVRVEDYGNFFMAGLIPIGKNSSIGTGAVFQGECKIGKNVRIYQNCFIENSQIGDNCILLPGTIVRDSIVEKNVQLGPYCHLRNGSLVKNGAKMGNFVEMKKSVFGHGSKAMHLTYIGDARVGRKVNIGAGTITCNYDGKNKNPTVIEDNVFIGSGTELVAPVTVKRNSYVGAGSTITENVPQNALAIGRQRQRNIPNWVLRKRKKKA